MVYGLQHLMQRTHLSGMYFISGFSHAHHFTTKGIFNHFYRFMFKAILQYYNISKKKKKKKRKRKKKQPTMNSRYFKHRYLKISSYIKEYSLDQFSIVFYILIPIL